MKRRCKCPVRGCDRQIRPERIVCKKHWLLVPGKIQTRIHRAYEDGADVDTKRALIHSAVEEVEKTLRVRAAAQQKRTEHARGQT